MSYIDLETTVFQHNLFNKLRNVPEFVPIKQKPEVVRFTSCPTSKRSNKRKREFVTIKEEKLHKAKKAKINNEEDEKICYVMTTTEDGENLVYQLNNKHLYYNDVLKAAISLINIKKLNTTDDDEVEIDYVKQRESLLLDIIIGTNGLEISEDNMCFMKILLGREFKITDFDGLMLKQFKNGLEETEVALNMVNGNCKIIRLTNFM